VDISACTDSGGRARAHVLEGTFEWLLNK